MLAAIEILTVSDTAAPYLTPYKDPEVLALLAPQYLLREKNLCQTSKNLSVIQIYGCTSEEVEQLHFFFFPKQETI